MTKQLAGRGPRCSTTTQSQLATHFGISGTKTAQMCETLRVLRSMVEDKARELGLAEDDVLGLVAGAFAKGNPIIDKDQRKALQDYEKLAGVSIGDSVKEALDDFIECSLSIRTETLAEHSAQS